MRYIKNNLIATQNRKRDELICTHNCKCLKIIYFLLTLLDGRQKKHSAAVTRCSKPRSGSLRGLGLIQNIFEKVDRLNKYR